MLDLNKIRYEDYFYCPYCQRAKINIGELHSKRNVFPSCGNCATAFVITWADKVYSLSMSRTKMKHRIVLSFNGKEIKIHISPPIDYLNYTTNATRGGAIEVSCREGYILDDDDMISYKRAIQNVEKLVLLS